MRCRFGWATVMAVIVEMWLAPAQLAQAAGPKWSPKTYDSKYYAITTDLDEDHVREAIVRLNSMAEQYAARTRGFAGRISGKFPFFLFSKAEDYYACGAPAGSSGVFQMWNNAGALLAIASTNSDRQTWHTVQHEGFHQFAAKVMTPRLPIWANEGMADYFAVAIWTGDDMVCGVIPPGRLKRIKQYIKDDKLVPFAEMLSMPHAAWNKNLDYRNYDQAWSMVHFLVHAEGGRYAVLFNRCINDVAGGGDPVGTFAKHFGRDMGKFQKSYCDWWSGLGDNPTMDLFIQANVQTLTSFLGRATSMKMKFASADEFFAAGKDGKLEIDPRKYGPKLWLPAGLLADNLATAARLKTWSLETADRKLPKLKLTLPDGTTFVGAFEMGDDVSNVRVVVTKPPAATKPASGPATKP
ncbi:MAG: DUF1570 domain-containing protein [Phycisphaerae bacterium]